VASVRQTVRHVGAHPVVPNLSSKVRGPDLEHRSQLMAIHHLGDFAPAGMSDQHRHPVYIESQFRKHRDERTPKLARSPVFGVDAGDQAERSAKAPATVVRSHPRQTR
jgi:hypothetical protein